MDFNRLIQHPEQLNRETLYNLRNYVALYPYHQVARLLMLHNLYILHDPAFDEELRKAAFFITDRSALFNLVEAPHYTLSQTHSEASSPTTSDAVALIDNFLGSISKASDAEHKPTLADATIDYMAYKLAEEQEEESKKENQESAQSPVSSIIDDFLEKGGGKITIPQSEDVEEDAPHSDVLLENDKDDLQEGFYTESLAKVYVKQGNYSKALEIIKQLNLNNSEKSTYFADQMRFLEKVIAAKGVNNE